MKIKSLFTFVCLFMLLMSFVNGVTIVEQTQAEIDRENKGKSMAVTFLTIVVLFFIFLGFVLGFVAICISIFRKLSEYFYKKKGFFYELFVNDLNTCRFNYDPKMKRRRKRFLWLFWKRQPIFVKDSNGDIDILGYYEGETSKKEGIYFLAIHNKVTMFKSVTRILVIPNEIKNKLIDKIIIDKKTILTLNCEGMDNIYSTDFYYIPLIKKDKNDVNYINFVDKVMEDYFKPEVYQDIIGEQLIKYRRNMIKNVESEPILHRKRREPEK